MKIPCDAIHWRLAMIGIYKIENLVNHKVYIGQSVDIKKKI